MAGRFGRREAVKGGHQWFMVSEKQERTTFKLRPEVKDSRIGCLKFTVKCRITLLSGRNFGREKGKGLPLLEDLLLKDTANMGIRRISGQRKGGCGMRMGKKSGMR